MTLLIGALFVTAPITALALFNQLTAWRDDRDNRIFHKRTGRLPY
jgi:hypothetical protein